MIILIIEFGLLVLIVYCIWKVVIIYKIRHEHQMHEKRWKERKVEIHEILKKKSIVLDSNKIKIATEQFMQALLDWKDKEIIKEYFIKTRSFWTEQELDNTVKFEKKYIDPVIKFYQPVYDAALNHDIDQPFDFSGYIHSFFTGFYWSELDYPEINDPIDCLSELLRGGLTYE